MYRLLALLCLTYITDTSAAATPSWKKWSFCKKSEVKPNENSECLVKAITEAAKDIIPGNAYFGTPKVEPLHLVEFSMKQSEKNKPVAIDLFFKDMDIIGLSSYNLYDLKSDWDNGVMTGLIKFKDNIQVISDYKISGKVILLPISGEGKANVTLIDLSAKLIGSLKQFEKKGKKYFDVMDFKVELEPKGTTFLFTNLFNGNKALGDNMNKFLNENWKEVMTDLKEPIGDALGQAFKAIAKRVFAKIPIETLYAEKI